MTAVNNNIPTKPDYTDNLVFFRDQCLEIQTLLFAATDVGLEGYEEVSASQRTMFKSVKLACKTLREKIYTDELSLALGHVEAIVTLVISANGGHHDTVSIEQVIVNELNNFRKVAGVPKVSHRSIEDLDKLAKKYASVQAEVQP